MIWSKKKNWRFFSILNSIRFVRASLTDMVVNELIEKSNKLGIVIFTEGKNLRSIEKDAYNYLNSGVEDVIGMNLSNMIVLNKSHLI
jgi:hypothetical protein